jgi:hypothetical protein
VSDVFYVYGSWGTLECESDIGKVLKYSPADGQDHESLTPAQMVERTDQQGYYNIVRCDIDEYRSAYPDEPISHIDILDIGTLDSTGHFEPAAEEFRRAVRNSKH